MLLEQGKLDRKGHQLSIILTPRDLDLASLRVGLAPCVLFNVPNHKPHLRVKELPLVVGLSYEAPLLF